MKKKHFKLGMLVLLGLAGCFLTLSVVLVASAGVSGDSGSGARAGGLPHPRTEQTVSQTANFRFQGKSPDHKSGLDASGRSGSEADPCLSSPTACIGAWNQSGDGTARNWQNAGDSGVTSGKSSSPGYPSSYDFDFFGAGGAVSGQFAGTGENGGSSQSGEVTGTFGTQPDIAPNDPIATPSQLSLFFPTVPPGPGDPTGPIDRTPLDPPPSGAAATISVPEPSTFWLFVASLTALVLAHGHVRRARPASRIGLRSISTKRRSFSPAANPPS